ncbi:MAG: hypothetical protein JOZ11_07150 [Alphaproteobacteria bacterium]|nr:hypothetical protein [Alphaproteobacteria bacterium]
MAQVLMPPALFGQIRAGRNHSCEEEAVEIRIIERLLMDCPAAHAQLSPKLGMKSSNDPARIDDIANS